MVVTPSHLWAEAEVISEEVGDDYAFVEVAITAEDTGIQLGICLVLNDDGVWKIHRM